MFFQFRLKSIHITSIIIFIIIIASLKICREAGGIWESPRFKTLAKPFMALLYFKLLDQAGELYVYYFSKAISQPKIVVYWPLNRPQLCIRPQRNAQVRFQTLTPLGPLEHPWKGKHVDISLDVCTFLGPSPHLKKHFC